jgi:hypothetical protein
LPTAAGTSLGYICTQRRNAPPWLLLHRLQPPPIASALICGHRSTGQRSRYPIHTRINHSTTMHSTIAGSHRSLHLTCPALPTQQQAMASLSNIASTESTRIPLSSLGPTLWALKDCAPVLRTIQICSATILVSNFIMRVTTMFEPFHPSSLRAVSIWTTTSPTNSPIR